MSGPEAVDPRFLEFVVADVHEALADNAIGAYLHGSTGQGRLRPRSDVDVLVVAAAPLSDSQRGALTELVLARSGPYPPTPGGPRPLELSVVSQTEVRPWRYPPTCDFLYGEWLRRDVENGGALTAFECPDLAILVTMARSSDVALFGPGATEVFDAVPDQDLVRSSVHGLPDLVANLGDDTANVLLTLARAWCTCDSREVVSKDVAAEWAIERFPQGRDILEHARAVYLGDEADDWTPLREQVEPTAGRLVELVRRAAEGTAQRNGTSVT